MVGDYSPVQPRDENGRWTNGINVNAYEALFPEDSYTNTGEYQKTLREWREAIKKDEELRDRIKEVEAELKNESVIKPRSEWDEEDEFQSLIGNRPRTFTERGKMLEAERLELERQRYEVRSNRDAASDELSRIKANARSQQLMMADVGPLQPAMQESYEGFKTNTTGTSFYDDVLSGESRKARGFIAEMSPKEYIERCAYDIFDSGTIESTLQGTEASSVARYTKMMASGTKFDLPYLDYKSKGQEGRHRALAAYNLGIEKIPVLIVR